MVLAVPATGRTRAMTGAAELAAMRPSAWPFNVGRGTLVGTGALAEALDEGSIAGAALDVTDPDPLPDGHALWTREESRITPHVANGETLLLLALAGPGVLRLRTRFTPHAVGAVEERVRSVRWGRAGRWWRPRARPDDRGGCGS